MALNTTYQYEQPKLPSSWLNDTEKRRFYNRLIEVLDDIYLKYGRIDENMLSISVRKVLEESGAIRQEVIDARGEGSTLTQRINSVEIQISDASIYDGESPMTSVPVKDKLWLDMQSSPYVLRRWRGAILTPSNAAITTERKIYEYLDDTSVVLDNSNDLIMGKITVFVQDLLNLSESATITYNDKTQTVTLASDTHSATVELEPVVGQIAISTDVPTMQVSYVCSGWDEVTDTSTFGLADYLVIDDEGVHIKSRRQSSELLLTNDAVRLKVNNEVYSIFAANYVQFGNYQLRRTNDGGLAFKLKG